MIYTTSMSYHINYYVKISNGIRVFHIHKPHSPPPRLSSNVFAMTDKGLMSAPLVGGGGGKIIAIDNSLWFVPFDH